MWKPSFIGLAVAAALSAALQPQTPDSRTSPSDPPQRPRHEIVVTAARIATPAREVASSVTVVAGRDLDRSRGASVLDALRSAVGLSESANGGPGSTSSILLRGSNSEHVLVLLDGVELNDPMNPSRSFDFAHLGLEGVERVEVLRGPQSPLYGSDALGGVINILTRRGEGRPALSFTAQGGSYGTVSNGLDFGGAAGVFHYALGLSQFSTRGFSAASSAYAGNAEKDGYRGLGVSGRAGVALTGGFEADLIVRAVSDRTDLDAFGGPGGDDPNSAQRYDSVFLRGQARAIFAGGRWEQKLGLTYVRADRALDNPVDALHPLDSELAAYGSARAAVDWQNNLFLSDANTLTFGLDLAREQGDSQYTSRSAYGEYDSLFPGRTADQAGLYVQDRIRLADRFFATAGARLDRHSRSGAALTYRIAPAYYLESTGTRFKATLGTGFKSPSLYQLYAPGTSWGPIGNAALAAERCLGWDAGIEQEFLGGALTAGVTYYRNDFRNLIDFDFSRGYINIGRARTRGVEISAEARAASGLLARLSYTSLEARDLDSGAALLRRPNARLTARVDVPFLGKFTAGLAAAWTGARHDKDFSGWEARDVVLAPYMLLDASLSYALGPAARLFVRADNILDARYETVYGYGTARFAVYGGITLGALR